MKVAVGFDHAGVPFHDVVVDAVRAEGHEPVDVGTQDDYPDAARDVSRAVHAGDCDRGIVVCGSGAGVAVAACKLPGIRAAVGHDTYTAAQCVQHDSCNVLALGARVIGPMVAASCVRAFVTAEFSGEERHLRRLAKIDVIEQEGFGD
jgi:ribose 5-phosphate isomerase B